MPQRLAPPTFVRETRTPEEAVMHETYRTLGRDHELDLERAAAKHRLAAALPPKPKRARDNPAAGAAVRRRTQFRPQTLLAWLTRAAAI